MPPVVAPYTIPEDVSRYCAANQLTAYLDIALRLAEEVFAPIQRIEVVLEPDPEVDEEYVVIDVWLANDGRDALEKYYDYTRKWVSSTPPAVIGRISLIFHTP